MKEESKNKLKKLTYIKPVVVLSVGLVILIGGVIWLGFLVNKKVDKIKWQRAHVEALENREDNYRQLQSSFKEIENQYQIVDRALPEKDAFISLVVRLEKLARDNKVELEIDFSQESEAKGNNLDFTLKVSGKINNVLQYLKEVKSEPYLVEVLELNLQKITNKSRVEGQILVNVEVDEAFRPNQISQ